MRKTALVTGASSGIGYELAKILARNNYDLVLIARTQSKLIKIADDFHRSYGIHVHVIACDLSQSGSCESIYEQIKKYGLEINILVNNAGLGDWGLFIDSKLEKQEQMLQLNAVALTKLTRLFLPEMVNRLEGRILNVASTAAFQPGPLMSVYFATKAYVLSFSSAIGHELKGTGVTVTCLCPGPTATEFQTVTFPRELRLTYGRKLPCAQEVAEYGYKAMLAGKTVVVPGYLNIFTVLSGRYLPWWITLHLVRFLQESKY